VLYLNPASASAGVVLDEHGAVLLIQRKIPPFAGDWAFPAGYQEIDEDPRDTVCREVVEETGILVEVTELLDVLFVPDDPRKPANVTVFLCRPVGGTLLAGSDAASAAWFPLDALPPNLGFDNNALILAKLAAR
jgi:8-oxo-dGTP diphosphatase